jgi:four helix bundle protein
MKDYRQWIVWQKSMQLVEDIYKTTRQFPPQEVYGLSSQMQRSAISIPSNIAEGYARISKRDQSHFYRISFASARELETQLEIAKRLEYVTEAEFLKNNALLIEVIKMLSKMVFIHNES